MEVSVSVKPEGGGEPIPCMAHLERDGASWKCGICGETCTRLSFGVINGFWRCCCGGELVICVNGEVADLSKYAFDDEGNRRMVDSMGRSKFASFVAEGSDEDFMKACGISAGDNEPKGG